MFDQHAIATSSALPLDFAHLVEETNNRIVQLLARTGGGHESGPNAGEIREVIGYLLAPCEVLNMKAGSTAANLVNLGSSGVSHGGLVAGLHRPFYLSAEERIAKEVLSLGVKRGLAPANLTEIVAVLMIAALSERQPDCPLVRDWRSTLDSDGKTPFSYMTGEVADAIVRGVAPRRGGVGVNGTSWSESLAIELLKTIVAIFGPQATSGYADLIVRRILAAGQADAEAGRYEFPEGCVVVSVIGLYKAGLTPFSAPQVFETVFGGSLEPGADLLDKLPERLEGSAYLWSGPIDNPERAPARRLAETVLQQCGWLRKWTPPVTGDRLARDLAANPMAYPGGMAERSVNGCEDNIVDPANGDQTVDSYEIGAASRNRARETTGALELLHSRDSRYVIAPLAITLAGKQLTGKTTLLSGICHDIMRGSLQLLPGQEIAFSDATQRFADSSAEAWVQGAAGKRTKSLFARYRISLGPIELEFTDIRGHELDQPEPATKLGLELSEGETQADRRARDQARLVDHIRHSNGIIVMCATPEFVRAARDGKDTLDDEAMQKLDLESRSLANIVKKFTDIGGNRGADHRPMALVVNRADEIFARSDLDAVYRSAALLGDEDRGGFGTVGVGDNVKSYALRTAIGTVSIAAQSKIAGIVDMLKPVLGFVARSTRRYEIFLTTGLPHKVDDSRQLASGPGQILQWLLDQLLPSYIAQALEQIKKDRAALADFALLQTAARRYARPLLVSGRWSDFVEVLPGGSKLQRRYRTRLTGKLSAALKRVGIALDTDPTPGDIQAALDCLDNRIAFTGKAIETAASDLDEFKAALSSARPQG